MDQKPLPVHALPPAAEPGEPQRKTMIARRAPRAAPASYKRPARIHFREALPKSPIGKVLHRELRANL